MQFPTDVKYTKNDEWIRVEGDLGTIGITDYAQDQLSDIVFVETTLAVGEAGAKGDNCATIESVKAAAEVYLPVGGTVEAVNEGLADTPELVNREPYGGAWILKIRIADSAEVNGLLDAAAYETFCQERSA
jgi:glycine cleavage system H protein